MGKKTIGMIIRDTLGGIGWRLFLWSIKMTEEKYFEAIYFQEKGYRSSNKLPL